MCRKREAGYEIHFQAYEVKEDEAVAVNFKKALEKMGIEAKLVSTLGGADNHQFFANGIKGFVLPCKLHALS